MTISQEAWNVHQQQRRALAAMLDKQGQALAAAWARAFDEIATDLDRLILAMHAQGDTPKVATLLRAKLARQALKVAAGQLQAVAAAAGVRVSRDLQQVINLALSADAAVVAAQLPTLNIDIARADARQIAAIVKRSTEQITARHYAMSQEAGQAMRRELVRSVSVGDNPKVAARRMLQRVQGEFNGGLTRALVISRTENLDAYRNAAQAQQQANSDVLAGWEWVADLSSRTCRSCVAMHGTMHPLAEPGPIDHQQGRCTRVPVAKTWKDLGFDVPEPPSAVPDSEEWFAGLPEDEQRRMLTNRGYDEWQAGRYPMSDWSRKSSTPGWRDSMRPSTPPESEALAS